jgi:hypothetical protein
MKYVILIYHNPASREVWEGLSVDERDVGLSEYEALDADLDASGEMIVSHPLDDPSTGKRVTARDGAVTTTDGPFAEAKEFLAGFYLVECVDEARAVEIAARVPEAAFGQVEVRPVIDLDAFRT